MIFCDLHTHTCFCDGKNSPEEMVKSAIEKGLKTIGLVVHAFVEGASYCVKLERVKEFQQVVGELKQKYKDKIRVLCGVEMDLFSPMSAEGFDYIIGSVHYFDVDGKLYDVDNNAVEFEKNVKVAFGGDYLLAAENYFSSVAKVCKTTNADIIGHFDLISKFNQNSRFFDEEDKRYETAWKSAVDKLIPFNKPFEINVGNISRGNKSVCYPAPKMIEYIKSKGGKFILSSDAHRVENIAFEFSKWAKIVEN